MTAWLCLFSPNLVASHARSLGFVHWGMKHSFFFEWMFLIKKGAKDMVPTLVSVPLSPHG